MKYIITILVFFLSLTICSCQNDSTNKLNLVFIEDENVRIEKYDISEISNIHQFIDLISKRWNKKERLLEADSGTIDSVYLNNDTIYLITKEEKPIIYDLAAIKFGYIIKVKTIEEE